MSCAAGIVCFNDVCGIVNSDYHYNEAWSRPMVNSEFIFCHVRLVPVTEIKSHSIILTLSISYLLGLNILVGLGYVSIK